MKTPHTPQHPAPETWAAYLYHELPPAGRAEMEAHLGGCADCRRQLEVHRQTQTALDAWKLPRRARTTPVPRPSLRWAVAAALAIGLGWVGGRFSAPKPPSVEQLRAELVPALKQELRQEFGAELVTAIHASQKQTQDRLVELAQAWAATREEDQNFTRALLQQAERQRRVDYATLRRDLETVALVAQDAIGTTQRQLTQLAANSLTPTASGGGLPR